MSERDGVRHAHHQKQNEDRGQQNVSEGDGHAPPLPMPDELTMIMVTCLVAMSTMGAIVLLTIVLQR